MSFLLRLHEDRGTENGVGSRLQSGDLGPFLWMDLWSFFSSSTQLKRQFRPTRPVSSGAMV